MAIKNKTLLVLGGISLSKEIIKHAKKLGLTVFVTDYLANSPAKKDADKSFMVSTTDIDAISALIKHEKIDGVLTGFIDLLLPYYAEICSQNGLFGYGTKDQFEKLIDKVYFKNLCRDFNIPVVEEFEIKGIEDIEGINKLPYPVLLKPADNSGGRGISICHNVEEFRDKYNYTLSFSKSGQIIIEKYMKSKEVSIFYMLQDGKIKLTAMGDRHIQYFNEGLIPLPVAYTFPSIHLEEYEKNINNKVIKMFHSLGLNNGMVFIQSFVENGQCIFYEMGYRLTGSLEYKIIEHASGFNPLEIMIKQAVKEKSEVSIEKLANPHFEKKYCNITFLVHPGIIDKIEGVEEIKNIDNVIDIVLTYNEGDEILENSVATLGQVIARVFAYADSMEELIKVMDDIHQKFKVTSTKGENMLLPHFNTNEIN